MRHRVSALCVIAAVSLINAALAQQENGIQWRYTLMGNPAGSPALSPDGETIYIGVEFGSTASGRIIAIPKNGGRPKWDIVRSRGAVNSSPAVSPNGTIYVGCSDGKVLALNPATGASFWEYDAHGFITS